MSAFIKAGVIEPWDNYIPKDVIDDIIPSIRAECTVDGKLYSWPFLLDVIGSAWHSGITSKAGVPDAAPATWDEFLASSKKIVDSKAAPWGATFDAHGWRSLVPIAHSMSTKVYTPDGLFDFTSEPAIDALKLMKQIMAFSNPDILLEGSSDAGVNSTTDEVAFQTQRVGLYFKYFNAPLRMAASWDNPKLLHLGPLPKFTNGEGSTVFWTTGCALFKYGQNKEKAAEYIKALTYDPQIWKDSIVGTPGVHPGQLPPYKSIYAGWDFEQARLDAPVRRPRAQPARPRQGDRQQPVWVAAIRHRQADLGNLPQRPGAGSKGGDDESEGGGAGRNQEGLIARRAALTACLCAGPAQSG